jgi:hypothetical protein
VGPDAHQDLPRIARVSSPITNNIANTTLAGPTDTAAGIPLTAAAAADTANIAKTIIHPSMFTPQEKMDCFYKAR